jgi:hypothetical protein
MILGFPNCLFEKFPARGEIFYREVEAKDNGGKAFSLDLENMIRHLDPPGVSFQKYWSGKLLAEITYYSPDVDNASIIFSIDKECKIYNLKYHDYR